MAAIKKFFEKRKLNVKFKRAGEGHRLDEAPAASSSRSSHGHAASPRASSSSSRGPESEAARRAAAEAALARMEIKQQSKTGDLISERNVALRKQV